MNMAGQTNTDIKRESPEKLNSSGPPIHEFFIQWHLTEKCNLRCKHCYQTKCGSDELSFPEITDVVEEVADTIHIWTETYGMDFSASFNITGGEPFLRRDIFEVLRVITAYGFDVFLLSNGTLIDTETTRKLRELGVRGVQVSVEGTESIHDEIRGKGSFVRSLNGIRHLLDEGIEVTMNATLSNLNAGCMEYLADLASDTGVGNLGFSRLVPSGRGKKMLGEMIDKKEVKKIYALLASLDRDGLRIVSGDPVAVQAKITNGKDTGCTAAGGCAAGLSGLTLRPDGTINPCRRLNIPVGNIRADSLREVWAGSDVLNLLRDKTRYSGKCGKCRRWADCRGCRAIAYAYSRSRGGKDFLAEDPQCFIDE